MTVFNLFKRVSSLFFGWGIGGKLPFLRRLHRFLYKVLQPTGLVLVEVQGGKIFVDAGDTGVAPYLLMRGVYGEYETEVIRNIVKPGMVTIDVGANIGYFTLVLAGLVGVGGKVYAFEPDRRNLEILRRNVKVNNLSNVFISDKAVSSCEGRSYLFRDKNNLGNSSVSRENVDNCADKLEISTVSLDEYLAGQTVDFIKVDVQGAEGHVIAGARGILARSRGVSLIMEFWPFGLRNAGADPYLLMQELSRMGFVCRVLDVQRKVLLPVGAGGILDIENNRPEGKGSAYILCQRS